MTKKQKDKRQKITKAVAGEGVIKVYPSNDKTAVMLEMHFCSAFLEMNDVTALILKLMQSAKATWGDNTYQEHFEAVLDQLVKVKE